MHFLIYKITNKINGKTYTGMHKTDNIDDGYMGSGKLIKRAIQKYGIENFEKEILFIFNNEEDMKNKEKEVVVIDETTYNLCPGGKGGFGFLNNHPDKKEWVKKGRITTNKILNEKRSKQCREIYQNNIKRCIQCEKELSYEKRFNKFCNHSCSAAFTNKSRISCELL